MVQSHSEALVTFGIKPLSPHIGYGYVRRGDPVADGVFKVREFTEKPNITAATQYVDSGEYYWNSGMFTWQIATILDQIKMHLPNSYDGLMACGKDWDSPKREQTINAIYPELLKISIDFAPS